MSDSNQSGGAWQRLSQVAVSGAEYDSFERLPHPKCLPGTRIKLLRHSYELLDDTEKSRIVWVHGTAGVGKSAAAFTIAERMRNLKTDEEKHNEKRLAGTFFFSRGIANRSTIKYFFATLAYQLARNFLSVKDTLMEAIGKDPALLQPTKSPREQMEALLLLPLRRLRLRLHERQNSPPLVFVIDALDECIAKAEILLLVSLLSQVLRDPGIPVTHILLTSRSEADVSKAIRSEEVYPLVAEIPVKTSADDETSLISLDGTDVDSDIVLFLKHSFEDMQNSHSGFPQPTKHELWRLAKRAGRRFIIASTMMKFIDNDSENSDPYSRLQLMLDLTCDLLPGTDVYELYNQIISTCTDPDRAYMHLSVVVTLVNPLPVSQISELLGHHQGRDSEKLLVQLRSIMDIPNDATLPVKIFHSSVRDYILEPSTRSRFRGQDMSPHTLLASSSLRLMMRVIPKSTGLESALSELSKQSGIMDSLRPKDLMESLAFTVEPPTAEGVLTALIWLRGNQSPTLYFWLDKPDGRAWLETYEGFKWFRSDGSCWLQTDSAHEWMQTDSGQGWLQTYGGRMWLKTDSGLKWLQTCCGREWLQTDDGKEWLQTNDTKEWLQTDDGEDWLQTYNGEEWLQTDDGEEWLQTDDGREWLQTENGEEWLQTDDGKEWLQVDKGKEWLHETDDGEEWLQTDDGKEWLQIDDERVWLHAIDHRKEWLQTEWLQSWHGILWLQTYSGQEWLQTDGAREWLQTDGGREWLQTRCGIEWLQTDGGREWLQTDRAREWLQTHNGQEWLQTDSAKPWLQSPDGREWLKSSNGQAWSLSTPAASLWVQLQEFSDTVEATNDFFITPRLSSHSTFQIIQQLKSLPDIFMFPIFLALTPNHPISATSPHSSAIEAIRVMSSFVTSTEETRERTRLASGALIYACQNWAIHLSQAQNPWNKTLDHEFNHFWENYLSSWLELQWCLGGLQSCLTVLSRAQMLVKQKDKRARSNERLSPCKRICVGVNT